MKVALVHEWIASYAGSERVLAELASMYPDAPIHATLVKPGALDGTPLADRHIQTSFIDKLPLAHRKHRAYLPLMPFAVEQHDVSDADVVISSSHAVAKGVLTRSDQLHIAYIHSPMRYAWDMYFGYPNQGGHAKGLSGWAGKWLLHRLRQWDQLSAARPDVLVANSTYVAQRIEKTYRRKAHVIHPPVDVEKFDPTQPREDFYLAVNRFVGYKRPDIVVEAFNQLGLPLIMAGNDGPELQKLQAMAKPNIRFETNATDQQIQHWMQTCKAFVFAGIEDFGIAMVEAQAAGAPVIAPNAGGAQDIVQHNKTGWLFDGSGQKSLVCAIASNHCNTHASHACHANAQRFSARAFQSTMQNLVPR